MENVLLKCTIQGRPGIKKNSKRNFTNKYSGRKISLPSERYEQWELSVCPLLMKLKNGEACNVPMNLKMVCYFTNHQHEPDLSNCYEGIQDILQKCEIITDDKLIYSHDGSRKIFGAIADKIEITLTVLE